MGIVRNIVGSTVHRIAPEEGSTGIDYVSVYECPMGTEVWQLYDKWDGNLRALYRKDGEEWFVWEASLCTHDGMAKQMGLRLPDYYTLYFDRIDRMFGVGGHRQSDPEDADRLVREDDQFRDVFRGCLKDYQTFWYQGWGAFKPSRRKVAAGRRTSGAKLIKTDDYGRPWRKDCILYKDPSWSDVHGLRDRFKDSIRILWRTDGRTAYLWDGSKMIHWDVINGLDLDDSKWIGLYYDYERGVVEVSNLPGWSSSKVNDLLYDNADFNHSFGPLMDPHMELNMEVDE